MVQFMGGGKMLLSFWQRGVYEDNILIASSTYECVEVLIVDGESNGQYLHMIEAIEGFGADRSG
jgi:hypothetical protein